MLEYFGIGGASTTDKISKALKDSVKVQLDPSRNMPLVRKLRILSCLNPDTATTLTVIFVASKADYGVMKSLLNELEESEMVTSKLYVVGSIKKATKQYRITQKGLDYVKEHSKAD